MASAAGCLRRLCFAAFCLAYQQRFLGAGADVADERSGVDGGSLCLSHRGGDPSALFAQQGRGPGALLPGDAAGIMGLP